MSHPIVHAGIRSTAPDASRAVLGGLLGWSLPERAVAGCTYVDSGVLGLAQRA